MYLTEEHKTLLSDSDFRITAERLVLKCGVRADLDGYDCLADAVILYGTEACTRFCQIYRILGERYHIGYKSAMRLISYAIDQAFDLPERLSKMMGVTIRRIDIHNSLVIAYLGKLFRNPSLSLYA